MSRSRRGSVILMIVAVVVASFSLTALSAEEGGEGGASPGDSTTTTVSGLEPAVDVGGEQAAAPEVDWTYRYMVPTGLALAGVIIVLTAVKYFTDVVRKRYRIVE